jgi:hypothetical protein
MTIYTAGSLAVLPGDFAAVHMHDDTSGLIHIGEILNGDGFRNYEHAITYVGGPDDLIFEAEPGGARLVPMHYNVEDCLWSTGRPKLALTAAQAFSIPDVVKPLEGRPYSWLDYFALAQHRLHLPNLPTWPGGPQHPHRLVTLRTFIGDTGHFICSQAVDLIRLMVGFHLFSNRWFGYVTPADLANLIADSPLQ